MALAVMALGAFVAYDSVTGLTGPGYAQVGPGVFPVIVGIGLLLAGGWPAGAGDAGANGASPGWTSHLPLVLVQAPLRCAA